MIARLVPPTILPTPPRGGGALPVPTSIPTDPSPVTEALARFSPDPETPCRPTSSEQHQFSYRATHRHPGYASWHRPLAQLQAEWFGEDTQTVAA